MLIPKTASCPALVTWAKNNGCWHSYTETTRPGDLPIFDFDGNHTRESHVGIVVSQSGGTVYTIEGNTSVSSNDNGGAVMRRTRYVSQITGFVRPAYTSSQTAARALELASSQVGVKESPANSNNVKYNTWYYGRSVSGSAYPWCMVFISWIFAALCGDIKTDTTGGNATVTVTVQLLKYGSTGSAVKKLQLLLNALGYTCGTADGEFGTKTLAAVKKYQTANGLAADGIVGAATWGKLVS